jgi:hypothetical protein
LVNDACKYDVIKLQYFNNGSLLCILFLVISRYKDVDLKSMDDSSLPLYNIMLDYYEAKLLSPSTEISELGKLKFYKV